MALIKCPECGREISDQAEVCIGCGCPINQKKSNNEKTAGKRTLVVVVGLLVACVALGGFIVVARFNKSSNTSPASKATEIVQDDLDKEIDVESIFYNEELNQCLVSYSLNNVQDVALVNIEDQSVLYWNEYDEVSELMEDSTGDEEKKYAEMVIEYGDFIMIHSSIQLNGAEDSGWIELELD